jgi:hypothetical protein
VKCSFLPENREQFYVQVVRCNADTVFALQQGDLMDQFANNFVGKIIRAVTNFEDMDTTQVRYPSFGPPEEFVEALSTPQTNGVVGGFRILRYTGLTQRKIGKIIAPVWCRREYLLGGVQNSLICCEQIVKGRTEITCNKLYLGGPRCPSCEESHRNRNNQNGFRRAFTTSQFN